jgi:hypothetical protein
MLGRRIPSPYAILIVLSGRQPIDRDADGSIRDDPRSFNTISSHRKLAESIPIIASVCTDPPLRAGRRAWILLGEFGSRARK